MKNFFRLVLVCLVAVVFIAPSQATAKSYKGKWKLYDNFNGYVGDPDSEKWGTNPDSPGSTVVENGQLRVDWPGTAPADEGVWLGFEDCPENIVGAKATFYLDPVCQGNDVHIHFGWHPGEYDGSYTWMDFGFSPEENDIWYNLNIEDMDYFLFRGEFADDIDLFDPDGITLEFFYDSKKMVFKVDGQVTAVEEPPESFGSVFGYDKGFGLWTQETSVPCTFYVDDVYVMRKGNCDKKDPKVKKTIPKKNAKKIALDLNLIEIHFNETMWNCDPDGPPCTDWNVESLSPNWEISESTTTMWSTDQKVFYVSRDNAGDLPPDTVIELIVAPKNNPMFRDLSGNMAKEYKIKFTTEK